MLKWEGGPSQMEYLLKFYYKGNSKNKVLSFKASIKQMVLEVMIIISFFITFKTLNSETAVY